MAERLELAKKVLVFSFVQFQMHCTQCVCGKDERNEQNAFHGTCAKYESTEKPFSKRSSLRAPPQAQADTKTTTQNDNQSLLV